MSQTMSQNIFIYATSISSIKLSSSFALKEAKLLFGTVGTDTDFTIET